MTRSEEYDFDPPKLHHALFRETSAWKRTVELLGRRVTVIQYEWRTILTNHPREGEQSLPGEFCSIFKDNRLKCRRLSRDNEFDNVWWLLFPWLASISQSTGFVGYYHSNWDDDSRLIQFSEGIASVYELMPREVSQTAASELNNSKFNNFNNLDSVLYLTQ